MVRFKLHNLYKYMGYIPLKEADDSIRMAAALILCSGHSSPGPEAGTIKL